MKIGNLKIGNLTVVTVVMLLVCSTTVSFGIMSVVGEDTSQIPLAVDFTCIIDGNWTEPTTWGGLSIPGTGDTWQIPAGRTVNITGNQSCGTGWNNGTLTFNASTGSTSLSIDNGAIITNNGIINASFPIVSSVDKTMSFIGDSLEVITGNQPHWGYQSYWNFTEIDFQFDIETGDNAGTFQINGTCRFDNLHIENGDTVYGNAERLEFDGNLTRELDSGQFIAGTSDVLFRSNGTTNIGNGFYNLIINDNAFLTIGTNIAFSNVLTIDGTTTGGITGSEYHVSTNSAVETPLVIGTNGLLTGIDYFAYVNTGTYNITASNNYGDLRCFTLGIPGSSSATMLGAVTCDNLTTYSGSPMAPFDFDTGSNDLTINYGLLIGATWASTFKCNDSTINVGEDGITIVGSSVVDADTSIIQSAGDLDFTAGTYIADTNTMVMTDNASIIGNVAFYNLTVDVGKTVTIDDTDNSMVWSGLMVINGTLDTVTNSNIVVLNGNTAGGEIIRVGASGSLASADVEVWGNGAYEIPEATYNELTLYQDNVATSQYVLTGDVTVTEELVITAITDLTYIIDFFTDDYNIICNTLNISGAGAINVSLNASMVDVETLVNIGANEVVNGNTSTVNLAGNLTNIGTFVAGTCTMILDGTTDQNITNADDQFYILNITNTDAIVTFLNNTNITESTYWETGAYIKLNSDMTVGYLTCTGVTVESTNHSIERYLFAPLNSRTIDEMTFINVTLVPPIPPTLAEILIPLLLSLIPVFVLITVFRGVMNSFSLKPTNKKKGPKK